MIRDYGDVVTLLVNGQEIQAPAGEPLIDLLNRLSDEVTHVCYHPRTRSDSNLRYVYGRGRRRDGSELRGKGKVQREGFNEYRSSKKRPRRSHEPPALQP